MEIISLNCNKLKIMAEYISFLSLYYGGGVLLERGGLISLCHSKGGLIREGAYLRGGGLSREITVHQDYYSFHLTYLLPQP